MASRRERIIRLLENNPGLTDREITDQLEGHSENQQPINQICRKLESQGILHRKKRSDNLLGNYLDYPSTHKGEAIVVGKKKLSISVESRNNTSNDSKKEGISILFELGFEEAGNWFIDNNELSFSLMNHSKETQILYAFVVKDEVKYIGKSIQSLSKRMSLYKNCDDSQRTNMRNHNLIQSCLENGIPVKIFAWIPKEKIVYHKININIAAGLEDSLIDLFRPEWNTHYI